MQNASLLIQAISSAITAIVTIFLVSFTYRYVRLTRHMLDHKRESKSADLLIDLEFTSNTAYFVVKNVGGSPATEITFDVEDTVPWQHGLKELEIVREGISYLPAGRTLKFWMDYPDWKAIAPKKSLLRVMASYLADGVRKQRDVIIDLAQFRGTAIEIPPERQIAEAIRRLSDNQRFNRMFSIQPKMKACPECAENIKFAAKRCHFCGAEQLMNAGENSSSSEQT